MRRPHWLMLITVIALAAACTAWAATPKKPAAPAAPAAASAPAAHGEMHFTPMPGDDPVAMDDEDGVDGDWTFVGDDDGGGQRVIERQIVRRGGPGDGMGWGMHRGPGDMGGPMGMRRGGGMGMAMLGRLDLTDAQKEKMRDIHQRQQRRDIQARADEQIARLDLRQLMSAEKPNGPAINAQIDKLARLRADHAKARVAAFLETRAVLTPEQLKKAHEMRMDMGPGHMGPGQGGRSGMGGMRWQQDGNGPGRRMRMHVGRDSSGNGPQ